MLLVAGLALVVGTPTVLAATSATAGAAPVPSGTFRSTLGYPAGQTVTVAPGTQGALQDAFVLRDGYVYGSSEQASGAWTPWSRLNDTDLQLTPVPLTWVPGTTGEVQELVGQFEGYVAVTFQAATGAWSPWTTAGEPGEGIADQPVAYAPATAHTPQHLFAMADTGHVFMGTETTGVTTWTQIGGTGVTFFPTAGRVTYAPGSNGSTEEVFAFSGSSDEGPSCGDESGTDREFVTWETDGVWHTWVPFGTQRLDGAGQGVTYGPGSNGSLQEMFGVLTCRTSPSGYDVAVSWEAPDGAWSPWESYGPTPSDSTFELSRVTVAPGSNGSLQEIFAIAGGTPIEEDGGAQVYVDWESPGGTWSGWTTMGPGTFPHWTATIVTYPGLFVVTYAPGTNGSLQELFATSDTYTETVPGWKILVNWENPGGTWSGWRSMGAAPGPPDYAYGPAVVTPAGP